MNTVINNVKIPDLESFNNAILHEDWLEIVAHCI